MDQVEEKCRELGLLRQGALEVINNAAFEAWGDGLLEVEDSGAGESVVVYREVAADIV